MSLVMLGVLALIISVPIVVWDLITANNPSRGKQGMASWTPWAYVGMFVAAFGLLLKVMSFAAVLLLAIVVTGTIWLWDWWITKKRLEKGVAILVTKAAAEGVRLEPNVALFIAKQIQSENVVELEGVLQRVLSYSRRIGTAISPRSVRDALEEKRSLSGSPGAVGSDAQQPIVPEALPTPTPNEPIWQELCKSFFPVILIVFFVRSFLVEPFRIPSGSMKPTLLIGDFILVNKFSYGIRLPVANKKLVEIGQPQRGDVIVFRYPIDPAVDYIKRVVGLPGDTIMYNNKRLTINGRPVPVQEDGVYSELQSDARLGLETLDRYRETLGSREHSTLIDRAAPVVMLGGVREFPSRDRCTYGDTGFTCTVPEGHYFMMGDNRDQSSDSRYWGFVPEQNIVGRAFLIWMNFGQLKRIGHGIQ